MSTSEERGPGAEVDDQRTITMPAGGDGLPPGRQVGPYRIERRLGEGGMGMVVLGTHGLLRRQAALKIMRPELAADRAYVDRFLREARAAAAVNHQHLVAIHDAGEDDGRTWLAFEFVPGGDLDLVLAKEGPFAADRALEIIAQCADGLQALHEGGLVHRDIKPHNIFLDARGRAKLGDFGLARQADGADRMTMTGTGMGTPAYMAPEQANGDPAIDVRADIHALGGTLYTLLTRRTPFTGATPWAVVNAVVNDPPPDPRAMRPDLPREISAIVVRAMAKHRQERYQSPAELARACRAAIARMHGGETPDPPPQVAQPGAGFLGPFAGSGLLWLAASAALLLLLPLGLNPLGGLAPAWRGPGYDQPGLWGSWLAFTAASAALLWTPLRLARGERPGRGTLGAATLLAGALGGILLWAAAIAVLDAAGISNGRSASAMTCAIVGGIAWLTWWARDVWSAESGIVGLQLTRLAQIGIPLLFAILAGHLIAAGGGDSPSWTNRLLVHRSEVAAADALALALPMAVAAIAPLLHVRTVQR